MKEFFYQNDWAEPALIVGGFIFLIVAAVWFFAYLEGQSDDKDREKIRLMGYSDVDEVTIFLNSTNWDYDDFIRSKGVRKAFKRFVESGDMSGIVKTEEHTSVVPVVVPMNINH